jgi:hypothetical protein
MSLAVFRCRRLHAAFITDIARLATLAAAAASQDDPRPPVTVNTIVGPMLVPAAAVAGPPLPPLPPGVKRDPVVWQPPLPAALRKQLPPETAAVLGQGAAPAPLPVGAPPEEGAEVQLAAFQPKQYRQLYHLVHQHAQLLMQVGPCSCAVPPLPPPSGSPDPLHACNGGLASALPTSSRQSRWTAMVRYRSALPARRRCT